MRTVIQRVSQASVRVENEIIGQIQRGLLVLVGVAKDDSEHKADKLARKIASLRIFPDEQGKMNKSVKDIKGEILVVSQFTLYGDASKGNRPSFAKAADPEKSRFIYNHLIKNLKNFGLNVQTGQFQAMMQVKLINDGPVTIILDI
jgi:D-tyrosyl-tRNA(Tyr) deacylase